VPRAVELQDELRRRASRQPIEIDPVLELELDDGRLIADCRIGACFGAGFGGQESVAGVWYELLLPE
jgi:hypothetical protein